MLKWTTLYESGGGKGTAEEAPHERWGHASVVVDQQFYIIGGFDGIPREC